MILDDEISASLSSVLLHYQSDFSQKQYVDTLHNTDILMNAFGITQSLKRENKQYWGRQLGKCWESLVVSLCQLSCKDFRPPMRIGADEPCDLIIGTDAIDTKYRVGSGDSGTLKKLKNYAHLLIEHGFNPVMLFVRENNLPAAMTAVTTGGWEILTGKDTFEYLRQHTNFDLYGWLQEHIDRRTFFINRGEHQSEI